MGGYKKGGKKKKKETQTVNYEHKLPAAFF